VGGTPQLLIFLLFSLLDSFESFKECGVVSINEHQKKGCDKVMDSKRNPLKLKLYPPLRNAMEGVYLAKGGNIQEHKTKVNALLKPMSSCLSTTLIL